MLTYLPQSLPFSIACTRPLPPFINLASANMRVRVVHLFPAVG